MDSKSQKIILILMSAALLGLTVISGYTAEAQEKEVKISEDAAYSYANDIVNQYDGIIRFHVVANSDSEADQKLKMLVKNQVFAQIEKGIADEIYKAEKTGDENSDENNNENNDENNDETSTIIRRYITKNKQLITKWAEDCVKSGGFDYPIQVNMGITFIPEKSYDQVYFPAGNYEALTIIIGEGKGENWWCVIFPPLCLVDCEDSAYQEHFGVDENGRLILKSKIKEVIEKNRQKHCHK